MNVSDSIKSISAALSKAQKEIGVAHKGANNPFFKSKYADLGAVMEACKDALNKNGICVLQPVTSEGLFTYVETVLLHETGEWISSIMRVSCKNPDNPQEMGSAVTYARRYSLQSIMFIPAEDDDGEKATAPQRKTEGKKSEVRVYNCNVCRKEIDKQRATVSWTKLKKFLCEECEVKSNSQ